MSDPNIVFVQNYHQYFAPDFTSSEKYKKNPQKYDLYIKNSNFRRGIPGMKKREWSSMMTYMNRSEACDKTLLSPYIAEKKLKELGFDEEKINSYKSMTEYMSYRRGSTGLFDEDGDVDKKRWDEIADELKNIKTNVYECVLSFTPEFSKINCNNKLQAYNLLKKVMPKYFEKVGLIPSNMRWYAAYHTNTDNRHIHIQFYEKTPTRFSMKGEIKNPTFKAKDFDNFKFLVANNSEHKINYDYLTKRDPIIAEMKNYIDNNYYDPTIVKTRELINATNKKQYNRMTNQEKEIIHNFRDKMFDVCPAFKDLYNQYIQSLDKTQNDILNIYHENNISDDNIPSDAKNFMNTRIKELNDRICNGIIKNAQFNPLLNKYTKTRHISFYNKLQHSSSLRNGYKKMENLTPLKTNNNLDKLNHSLIYKNIVKNKSLQQSMLNDIKKTLSSSFSSYQAAGTVSAAWKEAEEEVNKSSYSKDLER